MWNNVKKNPINGRNYIIFSFLCLIILLGGCKTRKKVEEVVKTPRMETFQSFSANVDFSFTFPNEGQQLPTIGGQVRILRDSVIIFSIQPILGMEVARICVTKDDVMVLNRMEKKYARSSLRNLLKGLPPEGVYSGIESILLNQLWGEKGITTDLGEFKVVEVGTTRLVQRLYETSSLEYVLNEASDLVSGAAFDKTSTARWSYGDFSEKLMGKKFPRKLDISLYYNFSKDPFGVMGIYYKKIELDKIANFDCKIPEGYEMVEFKSMTSFLGTNVK